jgi:hypothetical protein
MRGDINNLKNTKGEGSPATLDSSVLMATGPEVTLNMFN